MNDEQKNYTIKEISRYKEEIDKLYYRVNRNAMFAFCSAGLAIAIFAINNGEFSGNEIYDNLIGMSATGATVYNGIKAIQRICERAGLEHTVRMLEHETAMDDLDKPKQLVKLPEPSKDNKEK